MKAHARTLIALMLAGGLAACSDSSNPGTGAQLTFNLATRTGASTATAGLMLSPDTIVAGTDVLVFEKVELVVEKIEFERVNDNSCGDGDVEQSGEHDDDCEEVEIGPILLDLPLGVGVDHRFTVAIDTGTFDQMKFEIHPPEDGDDPEDQAFLAAHPDLAGISVRVTGTWNGAPFTFTSDLEASQEGELSPPLVVTETSAAEVTLTVDVGSWFLNDGVLVDPATAGAGGPNENIVKNNIKGSFEVFEDEDHDGEHDDIGDGGNDEDHDGIGDDGHDGGNNGESGD